jgi:hypothetical protein
MKINAEKFLAITAALAVGVVAGCSSSDKNATGGKEDAGAGGTSTSSSGGKTGSGGSVASGGKVGTGGTGNAGAGGKSDKDASIGGADAGDSGTSPVACLGDDAPAFVDAGAEGFDPCAVLPYYNDFCQPDAGAEGYTPVGSSLCYIMYGYLRPAAFAELRTCLSGLTGNSCAPSHQTAAFGCYDAVTARTCEKPKVDGGADPCAQVTSCTGVTAKECHDTLRSFTDDFIATDILPCLQYVSAWDGGACADSFWLCIPPYVAR